MEVSSHHTIVGTIYILVPVIFSIPYILILIILKSEPQFQAVPCYKIMFHIGLADMGQFCMHIIAGIFTLCQSVGSPIFEKFVGGFLSAMWSAVIPLMLLLAFNRFITIYSSALEQKLFSPTALKLWLSLCWLWGFVLLLCYWSPESQFVYYTDFYTWDYGPSHVSQILKKIDFWAILFQMLIIGIFYCAIVVQRLKMRAQMQSINVYSSMKREMGLVVQACLISLYTTGTLITWHLYWLVLPETKWTYMLINMLWIGNSCINTIIYLLLNKSIRTKVAMFLGKRNQVDVISRQGRLEASNRQVTNTKEAWGHFRTKTQHVAADSVAEHQV